MILKRRDGTGMAHAIGVHPMGWYSISETKGIHPESTVTATNGEPANVQGQGQGRLVNVNDESGGGAKAGTRTGGEEPQMAIVTVTVTGFVIGDARRSVQTKPDAYAYTTARMQSKHDS